MNKLQISENGRDIEIQYDGPDMTFESASVRSLGSAVGALCAAAPLRSFEVRETSPGLFDYEFTSRDGRSWRQTLQFASPGAEPAMTFSVADGWRLSEFAAHRVVRDLVVKLIQDYRVRKIAIRW